MKEYGYDIVVDGANGPDSREVCRKFQRVKDLAVDGIAGPDTWATAFEP